MLNKEKIYITGHRHPDTDSIAPVITYVKLRQCQGFHAIVCRLGPVNTETEYLLERFHMDLSMLFEDTRITLGEIEIGGSLAVNLRTAVMETLELINEQNEQFRSVTNAQGRLIGMVIKSDLAAVSLGDTTVAIQFLQETPPEYIAKTVSGKMIYMDEAYHLNGKISVIATAKTKLNNYELQNRLITIEGDSEAQEAAIRKGAGILVAIWTEHTEESAAALTKEYHCPIVLFGHGIVNTSRYLFFSPLVKLLMKIDPVSFNKNEFVDEVGKKILKPRHRSYSVTDDENHLVGYVSRYHVLNQHNREATLVDHNECAQSVRNIEKADLLEAANHHRVCNIPTDRPVPFRNEIVGGTAFTITPICLENQMSIPKGIAGLLLGAILSDTLELKSPTTTAEDEELARMLAEITELDIDVLTKEMFKVGSNISNKTPHEPLNQDIKKFEIDGRTVMTSQVTAYQISEVKEIGDTLQSEMVGFAQEKGFDLLVIAFMSILKNGSVFYVAGDIADVAAEAFPSHFEKGCNFQEDILPRRNRIVLLLSQAIINSVH